MLLLIAHIGSLSHVERVDSFVTALIAAAVMNPAARNNGHLRTLCDIEVIIDLILHS